MSLNATIDNIISSLFSDTLISGLTLTQDATYTSNVVSGQDLSTGTFTRSQTDTSIQLIQLDYSVGEVAASNGQILSDDSRFFIRPVSGVELTAMKDDTITLESKAYKVKAVREHALGSTKFCYEIQAEVLA